MIKTHIKFCGMTDVNDIQFASDNEYVNYIGIIFSDMSPRQVSLKQAEVLVNACTNKKPIVGVFMDQSANFIKNIINNIDLSIIQFHGNETLDFCNSFNKKFIKTLHISKEYNTMDKNFSKDAHAFLLDNSIGKIHGGTGKCFDWNILKNDANLKDLIITKPYFIAGGLNSNNIIELINKYNPYGVDVSSGVESSIGKKDHQLMKKFIENVRISEQENYEKN